MKKFLSVLMVLTMVIVPCGTNTCMASDYESAMSKIQASEVTSNEKTIQIEIIDESDSNDAQILEEKTSKTTPKKSSHKVLITSILVAIAGAGIYALSKFSPDGKAGAYLGKGVCSTASFVKEKKDMAIAYLNNIPELTNAITDTKKFFATIKENLETNFLAFKNACVITETDETKSDEQISSQK